jgi:hypothetical protein
MILLSFSYLFSLLTVLYGVLDSNIKLYAFCCQWTHQWERLRNQMVSLLIWLWWVIDLSKFEFESRTFQLFYLYLCFVWRIAFVCLMVGRWQVRHGEQWRKSWQEYETWCRESRSRVISSWAIGKLVDVMCGLYCAREDEEHEFLGWASKLSSTGYQWFNLKTTGTVCQ